MALDSFLQRKSLRQRRQNTRVFTVLVRLRRETVFPAFAIGEERRFAHSPKARDLARMRFVKAPTTNHQPRRVANLQA